MDNFELHTEVQALADSSSKYELAKRVIIAEAKVEALTQRAQDLQDMLLDMEDDLH